MSDAATSGTSAATAATTADALAASTSALSLTVETSADTASSAEWQAALQQEQDAARREWMALERRYHLRLVSEDPATHAKTAMLFLRLMDPDLPERFRGGEVELQLELPADYPREIPVIDFDQWSTRMSSSQVSALNAAFRAQADMMRGTFSLRRLLTWLDNKLVQFVGEDEAAEASVLAREDAAADAPGAALGTEAPSQIKKKRRARRRPCRYFARGKCTKGDECEYSHEPPKPRPAASSEPKPQQTEADGFSKAQNQAPKQSKSQAKGTDAKKSTRSCKFFARDSCKEGDKCRFSHERKPSKGNIQASKQKLSVPEAVKDDEVIDLEQPSKTTASKTSEPKISETLTATSPVNDSNEWTEAQQLALDEALKSFPPTMDKKERWTRIAEAVDGRTLNECIDRFKYLSMLIRQQQEQPVVIKPKRTPSPRKEPMPALTDEDVVDEPTEPVDETVIDSRLIPQDKRVAVETEPVARGAQIRLEDLFLHEIGTVIPHRLTCQVACANCPLRFDAVLSLNNAKVHKWCPRCSSLHDVALRPVFAHAQSNVLAYIDTTNCSIVDVLPSQVVATCLECGNEALMDKLTPGRRSERACFSCHVKLAMQMKRYVVASSAVATHPSSTTTEKKKKTERRVIETFEVGKPLPNNGVCEHYKHSYRWFRFQCCGKAFGCDVCHDASDCAEANMGKIASRMICGLCSREQSSQVKVCSCGNEVGRKSSASAHWEGGKGCRNQASMASTDKQKFRGRNKTESKKFKRVGAEAKARRESSRGADSS